MCLDARAAAWLDAVQVLPSFFAGSAGSVLGHSSSRGLLYQPPKQAPVVAAKYDTPYFFSMVAGGTFAAYSLLCRFAGIRPANAGAPDSTDMQVCKLFTLWNKNCA
jgi:hypothetical protein